MLKTTAPIGLCLLCSAACSDGSPTTGTDERPEGGGDTYLDASLGIDATSAEPQTDAEARPDATQESWSDAEPIAKAPPGRVDGCPEGSPLPVNRVRLTAAPGAAAELVGGRIQGSRSGRPTEFVDLAVIPPGDGTELFDLSVANQQLYRYLRFYAKDGSAGAVAELEFFHSETRLEGQAFGSETARDAQSTFEHAFDGDPRTAFRGALGTGNYVGRDVGKDFLTAPPVITPPEGVVPSPTTVSIAANAPSSTIRYTVDGSDPSRDIGTRYQMPFAIDAPKVTVRAVAFNPCTFESTVVSANYSTFPVEGQRSYHLGNSLTESISPWLEPIADSTSIDHSFARWISPGVTIGWLWENKNGYATPESETDFDNFVQTFAPIDHVSVQPFVDPSLDTEGSVAVQIYEAARAYSPDLQFWIFAQWPAQTTWARDMLASGSDSASPPWHPPSIPTSWEEATRNQLLFHEKFRQYVDDRVEGKSVLIVPGGLALIALKHAIERGEVPGQTDFFADVYLDTLHLLSSGQYLVALVFYACIYKQSPEGRVTFAGTGLTEAQALVYQRLAWETAWDYRWSGIHP